MRCSIAATVEEAVVFATQPIAFAVRDPLPGTDLDRGQPGLGVALWLRAEDAQVLHDRLAQHGVTILAEPVDGPFGRTHAQRPGRLRHHDPRCGLTSSARTALNAAASIPCAKARASAQARRLSGVRSMLAIEEQHARTASRRFKRARELLVIVGPLQFDVTRFDAKLVPGSLARGFLATTAVGQPSPGHPRRLLPGRRHASLPHRRRPQSGRLLSRRRGSWPRLRSTHLCRW